MKRLIAYVSGIGKAMIDNFWQAPAGLERLNHEICRTNHKLKRSGSGLERREDAIELSPEETKVPGNCRPLPKLQRKLSLNK
jgi:hypothetical protein